MEILDAYVAGINAYIAEAERGEVPLPAGFADLGLGAPGPWRPTDVVAAVSTVRALFGAGGGSELNNAAVLAGLVRDLGPEPARAVYEDFRNRDNGDGPVHTTKRFPYLQVRDAVDWTRASARTRPRRSSAGATPTELAEPGRASRDQVRAPEAVDARSARSTCRGNGGDVEPPRGRRAPLGDRPPDPDRRAAGRLLLAADPHGLRAPLAHDPRARRGLPGAVGDRRDGPHAGLRVDADRGRQRHDRHLRREAVRARRRRADRGLALLRVQGRVPADGPPHACATRRPGAPYCRTSSSSAPCTARCCRAGRSATSRSPSSSKRSTYVQGARRRGLDPTHEPQRGEDRADDFVDIFRESHNLSTNWSYANDARSPTCTAASTRSARPGRTPTSRCGARASGSGRRTRAATTSTSAAARCRTRRTRSATSSSRGTTAGAGLDGRRRPVGPRARSTAASCSRTRSSRRSRDSITPVRLVQMMEQAGLTDLRGRYVAPLALRLLEERAAGSARAGDDRRCCGSGSPRARCGATATATATTTTRRRWRSWTPGGSR